MMAMEKRIFVASSSSEKGGSVLVRKDANMQLSSTESKTDRKRMETMYQFSNESFNMCFMRPHCQLVSVHHG